MKDGNRSASVDKAFEMIRAVSDAGGSGVTLTELARLTGVALSTCHRYATSLVDAGAFQKDARGAYRLSIGLVALGRRALACDSLRALARPSLGRLATLSGHTAHAGEPLGGKIMYVDSVGGPRAVRLSARVGDSAPLHCTAMGKAVLAALPPAHRQRVVGSDAAVRTPRTLVGSALARELEKVAYLGFAVDDEENEPGVRCVGVAVVSERSGPVGALSVSGPAAAFSVDDCLRLAPEAMAVARSLARRIA